MSITAKTAQTRAALESQEADKRRELLWAILFTGLTGAGLVAGVAFQVAQTPAPWVWGAFGLAYLAGGAPAGLGALRSLLKGKLTIDLLMVLAAVAAAGVGEPRDGAILLFLFSLAETLEDYALGNTRRAVTSLMKLRPDTAHRRRPDGSTETVPVAALEVGDVVVVKPGERVPVDARVASGSSALDQSPITGESLPVDKQAGDEVYAGTVNGYGALELVVLKPAHASTLARMVQLVTEAQSQRAPSERFSAWFGRRYTGFVLLGSAAALAAFLLLGLPSSEAFYKAATLLVVASPCAIVISVPAAVLSALAAAARGGVLFKGGAALEDFGSARIFAFDKTGTLTEGRMAVTDVVGFGASEDEALRLLAALEAKSEHPIARSVLAEAQGRGLTPPNAEAVTALPGQGVVGTVAGRRLWAGNRRLAEAEGAVLAGDVAETLGRLERSGKTTILLGEKDVLGVVALADRVRPSAAGALGDLRRQGVSRLVMLTGDHPRVAVSVGAALGLSPEDIHAGLLPEDKLRLVRELSAQGGVAYLGDGVNDAAALAAAGVGVAMGTAGSDVALEAADVALLSDDLSRLPEAHALAQRAGRIIRQNLAFALGIMVVMVLVTLFWHLPLPLGVLGHEGGTLLVVANGLRLLRGMPSLRAS